MSKPGIAPRQLASQPDVVSLSYSDPRCPFGKKKKLKKKVYDMKRKCGNTIRNFKTEEWPLLPGFLTFIFEQFYRSIPFLHCDCDINELRTRQQALGYFQQTPKGEDS